MYLFERFIKVQDTIKEYKYDPRTIQPSKSKKVIAECVLCGKSRSIRHWDMFNTPTKGALCPMCVDRVISWPFETARVISEKDLEFITFCLFFMGRISYGGRFRISSAFSENTRKGLDKYMVSKLKYFGYSYRTYKGRIKLRGGYNIQKITINDKKVKELFYDILGDMSDKTYINKKKLAEFVYKNVPAYFIYKVIRDNSLKCYHARNYSPYRKHKEEGEDCTFNFDASLKEVYSLLYNKAQIPFYAYNQKIWEGKRPMCRITLRVEVFNELMDQTVTQ